MKITKLNEDQWLYYLTKCNQPTFYHTPQWFNVWAKYFGYAVSCLKFEFSDGSDCIFPFAMERILKATVSNILSGPQGSYGGILSSTKILAKNKKTLKQYFNKYTNVDLVFGPFQEVLFSNKESSTHILNLTLTTKLSDSYSKNHSRSIKTSQNNNVEIFLSDKSSDWDNYWEAYQCNLLRWKDNLSSTYIRSFFELLKALPKDMVQLWVSKRKNKFLTGIILFSFGKYVSYWNGVSIQEGLDCKANHLLFHEALTYYKHNKFNYFDFNPSSSLAGVERFKEGFGAEKTSISIYFKQSLWLRSYLMLRGVT